MKPIYKSIGAVATGFLVVVILSVVTDMILGKTEILKTEPFDANPVWVIIIVILYRTIYNASGCYLAARLAPNKAMKHAMILGAIGFVFTVVGTIVMWHIPPHWYPLTLSILALPAAWLGGGLVTKKSIMRKIIVLEFITLDGVMQAPGAPEEDLSSDFKFGGWTAPFQTEEADKVFQKMLAPADLLLGRKTFEIFANYWPEHAEHWPGIMDVNKYVLTNTVNQSDPIVTKWKNSNTLNSLEDIKKLKNSTGSDIKIWGSSGLVQLLLKYDLVDELWLIIHPLTLGKGKKLFVDSATPATFTLTESIVTSNGVIIGNYKRAGEVKTGTVGE